MRNAQPVSTHRCASDWKRKGAWTAMSPFMMKNNDCWSERLLLLLFLLLLCLNRHARIYTLTSVHSDCGEQSQVPTRSGGLLLPCCGCRKAVCSCGLSLSEEVCPQVWGFLALSFGKSSRGIHRDFGLGIVS